MSAEGDRWYKYRLGKEGLCGHQGKGVGLTSARVLFLRINNSNGMKTPPNEIPNITVVGNVGHSWRSARATTKGGVIFSALWNFMETTQDWKYLLAGSGTIHNGNDTEFKCVYVANRDGTGAEWLKSWICTYSIKETPKTIGRNGSTSGRLSGSPSRSVRIGRLQNWIKRRRNIWQQQGQSGVDIYRYLAHAFYSYVPIKFRRVKKGKTMDEVITLERDRVTPPNLWVIHMNALALDLKYIQWVYIIEPDREEQHIISTSNIFMKTTYYLKVLPVKLTTIIGNDESQPLEDAKRETQTSMD